MISDVSCAISDVQSVEIGEMNGETCSCNSFSIRRYVAEVRQRDVEKCWPFHPQMSKTKLKPSTTALLPSLKVLTFEYWKCLVYRGNILEFQERTEQQRDILEDNTTIDGQANALCRLENVVPCCIDIKLNPKPEVKLPFLLNEDETKERGAEDETNKSEAEDETNESGAVHHLSRGLQSEEILSENNVNKKNPELEAKSPCLLREAETKERGAEDETDVRGQEDETNEREAEDETIESGAVHHLSRGLQSEEILSENNVNKQNPEMEAKSPCLLREDETNEKGSGKETNESGAEDETDEKEAENVTNENEAAHHVSGGIKSEEILSENNTNKQNLELEAKSRCLLREDDTNEKRLGKETNERATEDGANKRVAEDETNEKGAACHISGGIKSEEILSENNINKQNPELESRSPCLQREVETNEKGAAHHLSGGIKPEKILSENNVNKKNPELKAKSPCLLREYETNERGAENETYEKGAEDETNEKGVAHHLLGGIKWGENLSENNVKIYCETEGRETNNRIQQLTPEGAVLAHHLSGGIKSGEILSENNVKIYCETEGRETNYRLKQLTPEETVLEGENAGASYLGKQIISCSDIFCPSGTCNGERDQDFINNEFDGFVSESWRLNTIDKVDILQPALTRCSVERIGTKCQIMSSLPNYMKQVVNQTLLLSQCRLTTGGNVQDLSVSQVLEEMGNNVALLRNLNESECKRLREKRKQILREKRKQILREKRKQKKHLMGHAITLPSESNHSCEVQYIPKRCKHCIIQRKSQSGAHVGSVQNNLVSEKSIKESFTSPFEPIVKDKTDTSSAVWYTLEKRENDIEQNKILNQQCLSNAATHNLRKVKVKRQCHCGAHFGSVHNDLAPQKSIPKSFTPLLEQIVNDKTNSSIAQILKEMGNSGALPKLKESESKRLRENRKQILREKRKQKKQSSLTSPSESNYSCEVQYTLKRGKHFITERKRQSGTHIGSVQNNLVSNKSIPESFTSPFDQFVKHKINTSSAFQCTLYKSENDIEQNKILNQQSLSNAAAHNLRKVKVKRQCHCGVHFGSVHNVLAPQKSIEKSFAPPLEQIVNDKIDTSSAVQCILEKIENDIEQKKILNEQRLSNAAANNLRKLKVKRKCHSTAHFGSVRNDFVPDRSISESFTSPSVQIMTEKTNNSSAIQYTLEKRENDIEQEKILDKQTLSNAATPNSRKLNVKRKCHHGANFGYMQNYTALDKSISKSLDISTKHRGQQLPENPFFCSDSLESAEASQIQGKWRAQSLTFGSSVPISGGFAVHSSGSSVANLKPIMWPHIPSFAKGTRLRTPKILLKDMFSQGKFVKRTISPSQSCCEGKCKRFATTEGNKTTLKEQNMEGHSPERVSGVMICMQGDSSKCRKRALELPLSENGQQPQKKKSPARSNIGQQPQKEKRPERSNIVVLALPVFGHKKT